MSAAATPVKLSQELIELAKPQARAKFRSVPKQIEHWARLGKLAEENPDMPAAFIQETLVGLEESRAGHTSAYSFG